MSHIDLDIRLLKADVRSGLFRALLLGKFASPNPPADAHRGRTITDLTALVDGHSSSV